MCFSALASFAGGAVLTSIGVATVLTNKEPSRRVFAAIPFVFGLQQISEGFVWVSLQSPDQDMLRKVSTFLYLIAAVVIWPTMVPLSILLMEKVKKRRIALYALLGLGIAVSLTHVLGLLIYEVTARISSFHILYTMASPHPIAVVTMTAYLIATIVPLLISSVRRMYLFGIVIVVSYTLARILYQDYLVSVWCFFAAVASVGIWWILKAPSKPDPT